MCIYFCLFTYRICSYVIRLILPPFVVIPIMQWCAHNGFIDASDRLLQLSIVVQCCVPSAQLLIVALSQLQVPVVAGKIAFIFIFQYLVSIITVTLWTTYGIAIIYT